MGGEQDKETGHADGDYLGYGVYAQTLWARIEAALNKDLGDPTKLGDDPLVVGIFGEWGAGKSKLLSLILERAQRQRDERIAAHKQDDGFSLTVPVFFQPWKYEHERHLLVPLLLHIEAELTRCLTLAESTSDRVTGKASAVADAVKAHVPAVVEGFKTLWGAARTAYQLAEPASAGVLMPLAEWLAGQLTKDSSGKKDGPFPMAKFRWDAESGRSYYELHEVLKAVTRPTPEGIAKHLPKAKVDSSFRINFVIFIDDLDRCLPEKAVETLELIKTVFNLESFAFVLALDEEVVERGIGHRYKDYALVNKKPEMPITGFEYLEKIVHLPFRLPALSRQEGLEFLERYELALLESRKSHRTQGYTPLPWFSKRDFSVDFAADLRVDHNPETGTRGFLEATIKSVSARAEVKAAGGRVEVHLGHAALNGFDAFVPRKLIRVVELFHQVVEVAHERGRPVDEHLGGERDPRWVLAFVMLQLFQPDLYRLLRRLGRGVDTLRDAFAEKSLRADMADMELLNWACYGAKPVPTDLQAAITAIANNQDEGIRSPAQRIRLPIVERLLAHRAEQRHAFDPLKLFAGLTDDRAPFPKVQTRAYFSLLSRVAGETDELRALEVVRSGPALQRDAGTSSWVKTAHSDDQQPNREPPFAVDLDRLFLSLISAESSERRSLAQTLDLQPGQRLPKTQVQEIANRLMAWLSAVNSIEKAKRQSRASDGLLYLAPYLAPSDGEVLWKALGKSDVTWEPKRPYGTTEALKNAARAADLQDALRLDKRFNPQRFHLPAQRFKGHTEEQEPIAGFVRVPGRFTFGAKGKRLEDNPPRPDTPIASDFYIARYLTTVDQYAHFVADNGYGEPTKDKPVWWDTLGWAWRTGQWDSQVKEKAYRELARRQPELRGAPMNWAEQQAHGSRPVMCINWFEARAYARWLTLKLGEELRQWLPGYAVTLPTEVQWERAARAKDHLQADEQRQYPWGGEDASTAHLYANIASSRLMRTSPVGLFSPNPLGLCDLSGNAWEWQNNLYVIDGRGQEQGLDKDVLQLRTHDELANCDLLALRGSTWASSAEEAYVSVRGGLEPVGSFSVVGFRVVLSLAQLPSDT